VVLASVAIMLALVVAYARQAGVDSDQFANRATVALHDDSVRSLIAQKVTDELVLKKEEDLLAARPIIESVASEIVGGRAFTSLFRKAVRDLHRALFKRDRNTVTLTLTDVGTVLAAALEQVRPALAEELQSTERVELIQSNIGSLSATLADVAETVELLALFLVLLSLVLVAGALVVAPDRRQAVVELRAGVALFRHAHDREVEYTVRGEEGVGLEREGHRLERPTVETGLEVHLHEAARSLGRLSEDVVVRDQQPWGDQKSGPVVRVRRAHADPADGPPREIAALEEAHIHEVVVAHHALEGENVRAECLRRQLRVEAAARAGGAPRALHRPREPPVDTEAVEALLHQCRWVGVEHTALLDHPLDLLPLGRPVLVALGGGPDLR
jgi:hypothetical protein